MKPTAIVRIVAIVISVVGGAAMAADEIEGPTFDVTLTGEAAELRHYAPMIVAEVRVAAEDTDAAASIGFMPLANYIFGDNRPGEKIEMTAPVTTAPVTDRGTLRGGQGEKISMTAPVTTAPFDDGVYAVRFMMPSKWTMDTLPAPTDDRVALFKLPERYVVVAGFTGPKAQASIDAAERAIDEFIAANGLSPASPFTLAGYSAPSVPDAQKKWEVHREVEAPN